MKYLIGCLCALVFNLLLLKGTSGQTTPTVAETSPVATTDVAIMPVVTTAVNGGASSQTPPGQTTGGTQSANGQSSVMTSSNNGDDSTANDTVVSTVAPTMTQGSGSELIRSVGLVIMLLMSLLPIAMQL